MAKAPVDGAFALPLFIYFRTIAHRFPPRARCIHMRIPRLYLPAPLTVGATVALDDNAFNHAVRVLRLKPGAALMLFDGEGGAFAATLTDIGKRDAWVRVIEALPGEVESPLRVVLAQGISRGEKMDYTLQKTVELGVAAIQPLFTERGGVDLSGERLARKVQHWRAIVVGACEQCGRNRLPDLREPLPLAEWLAGLAETDPPALRATPLKRGVNCGCCSIRWPSRVARAGTARGNDHATHRFRGGVESGGDRSGPGGGIDRRPAGAAHPAHRNRRHRRAGGGASPVGGLGLKPPVSFGAGQARGLALNSRRASVTAASRSRCSASASARPVKPRSNKGRADTLAAVWRTRRMKSAWA